jgi:PKD repeat protein
MRFSQAIPLAGGVALFAGCADQGPSNIPPHAVITAACQALTCQLSDSSTDPDGTIESRVWDLGDGTTSIERAPVHTYAAPGGQFTVMLTVTDDDGDTDTAMSAVTVALGNSAPRADFIVSCTNFTCTFTDRSTDPDTGDSVVTHAWDFGDGTTSSEQNPTHMYASPGGLFIITLRVTDRGGARTSVLKQIDVGKDRAGTYERETPHSNLRNSRFVIRSDGTFELHELSAGGTTVFPGRWEYACCWSGWAIEPHLIIVLDFADFMNDGVCGEAYGAFLLDGHLGIAYCSAAIRAGLEEGVYTTDPPTPSPGPPPPQAGQIAFVRNGQIHSANTDGSGVVQLTTGPADRDPAWSADGNRIAFTRAFSWDTTAIFVMDADGSNLVRLTDGAQPTWSPDGEWIAFACWRPNAPWLCKVRTDGTSTAPDTIYRDVNRLQEPAWSPDGTRIAYISDWARYDFWFDIWVIAPDGSSRTALTTHTPAAPTPYEHYQPAWSPDGRRIAFVKCYWAYFYCSASAISVINADGSGVVSLVAAGGFAHPAWSPDGQVIAFASSNRIEWVSADGTRRGWIIADGHSPAWRP